MTQVQHQVLPALSAPPAASLRGPAGLQDGVGRGAPLQAGAGVGRGRAHGRHAAQRRVRAGRAVIGRVGLAVAVQVAVDILHGGELFQTDRAPGWRNKRSTQ